MTITLTQLTFPMVYSFVLLAIIIAIADVIQRFGRKRAIEREKSKPPGLEDIISEPRHFILLRILLDKNEHASLSTFQFLLWTLLISFLYLTLWFLQFLESNTVASPLIPSSLMALMGISVGVPIATKAISDYKKLKNRPEDEMFIEPNYASMLEENGKPSLLRLQMFLWTLASIVIYFWLFLTQIQTADISNGGLALPEIDSTLLFLMGLSQAGYLGSTAYSGKVEKTDVVGKALTIVPSAPAVPTAQQTLAIRDIIPFDARSGELITILGSGFGMKTDTIMIGQEKISNNNIKRWEDSRIEFTMPDNIPQGKQNFVVISEGNSINREIKASDPQWIHSKEPIDADIISEIWIDDPSQKGYRVPPIGYFIPNKRYYFFFEFAVPSGTPSWGRTEFRARFYVNGKQIGEPKSFLPGYLNGKNYGVFDCKFDKPKEYNIEIRGATKKTMTVVVKQPPGMEEC